MLNSGHHPQHVDVLVVGAGPTGMILAGELVRHGLTVRVIEHAKAITPWSKAQVLHSRTLELLEQMGIVGDFLERGRPLHMLSMYGRDLRRLFHFSIGELDSNYPFMLSLPQRDTEHLLDEHLLRCGVQVERQVRFLDLAQDEQGVTATVQAAGALGSEQIHAGWLVGCDGAHSAVRHALGIGFEGNTYQQRVLQADLRIDWPLRHAEDEIIGLVSEHGPLGAFPLPGEHRYRLLVFDGGLAPTLENFQFLLETRGPPGATCSEPAWMIEYTLHCRLASRYRRGRVFLAGDAAHTHSPATGQGMNTGMQDAFNLAWKLALVHKGLGRPALLDSYEAERMPVAAALLDRADLLTRGLHGLLTFHNPVAQGMRNYLMHFVTELGLVQRKVSRNLSMLDVSYPSSPVIGQHHGSHLVGQHESAVGLRDWLDFGHGPAPGQRAFDGQVIDTANGETRRLYELGQDPRHALYLFCGVAETPEGYGRLVEIGQRVRDHYPRRIHTYLVQVSPHPIEGRQLPWDGPLLFDRGGVLHQHYGARGECLYLIRPDGYVGYRSQPADPQRFYEYLDRVFT